MSNVYVCLERASQYLRIRNCLLNFLESNSSQYEPPLVKELFFFPFLHEKTRNLAARNKTRCTEMEEKIRAAGSYCMDHSYFGFLSRLAGKSKPSGFSISEKSLAKGNATFQVAFCDGNKYQSFLGKMRDVQYA